MNTLDQIDIRNQRVLIRTDLNVPIQDGTVTSDARIQAALPTIRQAMDSGAAVLVMSHLGRPTEGAPEAEFSLAPVAARLTELLGCPVELVQDWIDGVEIAPGEVKLLENVRFLKGEKANDEALAARIAALCDVFVMDAFAAAHRAHASTEGLARRLPAYAGRTMQAELEALEKALTTPKRPVMAVVGGAKVSSKIDLLANLVKKVDTLVIGGGMANTFLAAKGVDVGKSLCEHDLADTARMIMAAAEKAGCEIVQPADAVVAKEFKAGADNETVALDAIPADGMILDVGPASIAKVNEKIDQAATLVWNGPLGAFEIAPFDKATVAAAQHAAERTKQGKLNSVAGGGDTVAALNHANAGSAFSYVSTAGGAFLEWLEGKELPGVKALEA